MSNERATKRACGVGGVVCTVWAGDVSAAYGAYAAVGGEDDDGRQRRLQRLVEVREALDVQHVHLPPSYTHIVIMSTGTAVSSVSS